MRVEQYLEVGFVAVADSHAAFMCYKYPTTQQGNRPFSSTRLIERDELERAGSYSPPALRAPLLGTLQLAADHPLSRWQ